MITKLLRKKSPEDLVDEAYDEARLMHKHLTAFDLLAFGVGATALLILSHVGCFVIAASLGNGPWPR